MAKAKFQPSKLSSFLIETLAVGGWYTMISIDSFGWNFYAAIGFVFLGFLWAEICFYFAKHKIITKIIFIILVFLLASVFLVCTKLIKVQKIKEDISNNIGITVNPSLSGDPYTSSIQIKNISRNQIGIHHIIYILDDPRIGRICPESDEFLEPNGRGELTDLRLLGLIIIPKVLDVTIPSSIVKCTT